MREIPPIKIPSISVYIPEYWKSLEHTYRKNFVIIEGTLNFTDTFFYISHTTARSTMAHSLANHMNDKKSEYAKRNDFSYRLLKSAFLESMFGLRESIAGLVNALYELNIDVGKSGSTWRIYKKTIDMNLTVSKHLGELIPNGSLLSKYLKIFRHPHVHQEDVSNFQPEDLLAAMAGHEQATIKSFITEAKNIANWVEPIEKNIAQECEKHLGF